MLLPTKHIKADKALLGVGSEILDSIGNGKTISSLWESFRKKRQIFTPKSPINYDWFILTVDFLFMIEAVKYERGVIRRVIK